MNDVEQLIKTVIEQLNLIEMKTVRDRILVDAGIEIAPQIIPLICDGLSFPWAASDSPIYTFDNGISRPAQTCKLRTRFDYMHPDYEKYYSEFATELADELNQICQGRTVAFYGIIKPMGVLGDRVCLATRFATKTSQTARCWKHG